MKYNYIIDQWEVWPGHQYRIVEVGYRDSSSPQIYFVLETLSNDSQGEKCWVETVHQNGRDITNVLANRLKSVLLDSFKQVKGIRVDRLNKETSCNS